MLGKLATKKLLSIKINIYIWGGRGGAGDTRPPKNKPNSSTSEPQPCCDSCTYHLYIVTLEQPANSLTSVEIEIRKLASISQTNTPEQGFIQSGVGKLV